jgi:hypothetical protein
MTRERRRIELTPDDRATPDPATAIQWERTRSIVNGAENRWRVGDTLHIHRHTTHRAWLKHGEEVEVRESHISVPARIDYDNIFDATKVVIDEYHSDTPWHMCDGWEHTELREVDLLYPSRPRGKTRDGGLILLDNSQWNTTHYLRDKGASKQVAAECCAAAKQRTLDQLVEWYNDGWWWYGVVCDYHGYEDSVWGLLEDEGEHIEELRHEMAESVANSMTQDGYVIYYTPDYRERIRRNRLEAKRRRLHYNLHMFDWNAPD